MEVVVFTREGCKYCEKMIAYLNEKGVKFEILTGDHMKEIRGLPALKVGENYISGYNERDIDELLKNVY